MSLLQKITIIIGFIFLISVLYLTISFHFPLFLILVTCTLTTYVTMNIWWVIDIKTHPLKRKASARGRFYIINYPDTLWAFYRYLRQRNAAPNDQSASGHIKSNDQEGS